MDALEKGIIEEPVHRLARYITEEIDQTIQDDTAIEIIDAVRLASEDELRREGLAANETYHILGETRKYRDEKGRLQFAIRLYRGADADTLVEEWGHRWYWKMSEDDRRSFSRIAEAGSPTEAAERFAKGFRDYFYAHKYREEIAGPIAYLFRKAKEVLTDLVRRI